MLSLNFDLYNGKTLLRDWWKQVKAHFTEVEEAHNGLEDELSRQVARWDEEKREINTFIGIEAQERMTEDGKLVNLIDRVNAACDGLRADLAEEAQTRGSSDDAISASVTAEQNARETSEAEIREALSDEQSVRRTADARLEQSISSVESRLHSHSNLPLLEQITAEIMDMWSEGAGCGELVRRSREALSAACVSLTEDLWKVYGVLGVTVYDGGADGAQISGAALNGGAFGGENTALIDCGLFTENIFVEIPSKNVDLSGVYAALDDKVDKEEGKTLSSNDYSDTEKTKLAGIAEQANKYVHPATHSAEMITTTARKQFISNTAISTFAAKLDKDSTLDGGTF